MLVSVLRALQGCQAQLRAMPARADFDWPRPDRRREFLRARIAERRPVPGEFVVEKAFVE